VTVAFGIRGNQPKEEVRQMFLRWNSIALAAGAAVTACAIIAVSLCVALVPAVWSPGWSAGTTCTNSACSAADCKAGQAGIPQASNDAKLSEEQIQKVLDWLMQQVRTAQGTAVELQIDPEIIAKETGVVVTEAHKNQLLPRVLAMLQGTEEGRALLASETQSGGSCSVDPAAVCAAHGAGCTTCATGKRFASRCAEYGACSLYGDLSGASGDVLDMYVREEATDGKKYSDFALPAFQASDLQGARVTSADLVGRPTVLAFLAGHCSHSFDTLPILQQLERGYDDETLRVVGVYINSGSAEDVGSWIGAFAPEYEVWVEPTDALGDVIDSHLVPTYLLVDEQGKVLEKLVGYKTQQQVEARLAELLGATQAQPASNSGD
jgi:thiol-disulfide isomerase/thioredoxin